MELPEIRVYSVGHSPASVDLPPASHAGRGSVSCSETAMNGSTTSKFRKTSSTYQSPQLCNVSTDESMKRAGKVRVRGE